jgi:hypothetical protein
VPRWAAKGEAASTFAYTDDQIFAMTAALRVLLDEAPTNEDFVRAYDEAMRLPTMEGNFKGGWNACVRWYGARLLPESSRKEVNDDY